MSDTKTEATPCPPANTMTPEQISLLWQHALHEETVFNERNSYFLVAEAMFFVFFATLDAGRPNWVLLSIAFIGVLITIAWIMISHRQLADLTSSVHRLRTNCSNYQAFAAHRNRYARSFRTSGPVIFGIVVPILILVTWAVLLVECFIPAGT